MQVDPARAALRSTNAAAVGGVITGIGNGEGAADGLVVVGAQVVAEEEQLVFDDGSADAAAEVVVGEMAERPGEVGAGVDGVVLDELEGRTVELVGSGLEGHIGDGADGAAKFRFKVIGGDVDGLDGLGRRNEDLEQAGALVVVDAFDLIEVALTRGMPLASV